LEILPRIDFSLDNYIAQPDKPEPDPGDVEGKSSLELLVKTNYPGTN
jgi:hypothetical protein